MLGFTVADVAVLGSTENKGIITDRLFLPLVYAEARK